jgi:hypothetical protein
MVSKFWLRTIFLLMPVAPVQWSTLRIYKPKFSENDIHEMIEAARTIQ